MDRKVEQIAGAQNPRFALASGPMSATEYPATTGASDLATAPTTLVERLPPPLAALPHALPEIIAAAERAVSDTHAPIEVVILGRLLLHHREATAREYARDVRGFVEWCWKVRGIGILDADRATVELWVHSLEAEGKRARTVRRRLSAVQSYFLEAVDAGVIERVPTLRVKRPRVSEPTKTGLSREDASLLLDAAEDAGPREEALVRLLLLNGLRASEAAALTVGDIGRERGHRTATVHRKGSITTVEAVSARTSEALDDLLTERRVAGATDGDHLFVTRIERTVDEKTVVEFGGPLSRHGVARITQRLGRAIGTAVPLNPHELRHAFITLGLDAGATLRDLQRAAAHADPRTTANYDRRRKDLDRHPSYLVERYLA